MSAEPTSKPAERHGTASLGNGLQRFVDATQRFTADRTDLLKVEAGDEVREGVRSLPRVIAPALLVAVGWTLLVAALVTWLSRRAPLEAVLAAVGAAHAGVGLAILVRRARQQP